MYDNIIEKNAFLKRIGHKDKSIEKFELEFDTWIESLPEEVRPIVFELLKHFDYYPRVIVNEYLKVLHTIVKEEYEVEDRDALHTHIKNNKGLANSSGEYFQEYKLQNDIGRNYCYEDITAISDEEWENIENVILIDDFCGTGGSLKKYLTQSGKSFMGKNVFYLVIHIMEQGLKTLKEVEKELGLTIIPIYITKRGKAFEIESVNKIEQARETVRVFSRKVNIPRGRVFGISESEAIVSFFNNTPNNTLGIFGYTTESYNAPFPRKNTEEKASWRVRPTPKSMSNSKQERKQVNYNAKKENCESF